MRHPRWSDLGGGDIFRTRPYRTWDPPSILSNGYRVFPGSKSAGWWPRPPTTRNAEVNERVELYFYSISGPSWHVLGRTLHLPLPSSLVLTNYKYRFFSYQTHERQPNIPPVALPALRPTLHVGKF